MTSAEFSKLAKTHRLRGGSLGAARMVLVDGLTGYAAAKKSGLAESTVSRALDRLRRPICPACHRPE